MTQISNIEFDRDGLIIWTIGSDDYYIDEYDFKRVRKAMREWKKSKFGKSQNHRRINRNE